MPLTSLYTVHKPKRVGNILYAYFILRTILCSPVVAAYQPPTKTNTNNNDNNNYNSNSSSSYEDSTNNDDYYDIVSNAPSTYVSDTPSIVPTSTTNTNNNNNINTAVKGRSTATTAPPTMSTAYTKATRYLQHTLDPLQYLLSPTTISTLLKSSVSNNVSLKYCTFELSASILSHITISLDWKINPNYINNNNSITTSNSTAASSNNNTNNITATNTAINDNANIWDEEKLKLEVSQIQSAAEYYVSIAKEKKLLQIFAQRLKIESCSSCFGSNYTNSVVNYTNTSNSTNNMNNNSPSLDNTSENSFILASKYTRATAAFLLQWQLLRRLLGLIERSLVKDYLFISAYEVLYDYDSQLNESIRTLTTTTSNTTNNNNENSTLQFNSKFNLLVTHITSNSIYITWRVNTALLTLNLANSPSTSTTTPSATTKITSPSSAETIFKSPREALVFDIYIQTVSSMGAEPPVRVLTTTEPAGEHRIRQLQQDTLYRIMIRTSYAHMNNTNTNTSDDYSNIAMIDDYNNYHTVLGMGIYNTNSNFSTNRSKITSQKLNNSSTTTTTNTNNTIPNSSGNSGRLVEPVKMTGYLPDSYYIFVSTESPLPCVLNAYQSSPALQISRDKRSVKNHHSKKWSTCRGNTKMSHGQYSWDVHIDKCISKNIFIGVCTVDAKLDNYVGCDKYGWGFLANKAVWYVDLLFYLCIYIFWFY